MRVNKFRPRENQDKLIYGHGIVAGIVQLAVSEIPYAEIYRGVSNKKSVYDAIKVTVDKMNVSVDVTVKVHFSQSVSEMAFRIQEAIKYNLESMTDYVVGVVNVYVKGVTFEDIKEIRNNDNGNGHDNHDNNHDNGKTATETETDKKPEESSAKA